MKDFITIFAENEIEIAEDKKAKIKKELADNYKTIAEFNKKVAEIEVKDKEIGEKEKTINDLSKKIKTLEDDNKGKEDLQKLVDEYQTNEQKRKDEEAEAKRTAELKASFVTLKGDKEYCGGDDGYIANGIFSDWRKAVEDESNKGKSYKEVYEAVIKDKNDIFVNPNQQVDIPPAGKTGNDTKPKFKNFF